MTTKLSHLLLGTVVGLDRELVTQYRGIKYASLDHQFAEAVISQDNGSAIVDATSFGPGCIQDPKSCEAEFTFIQHALPCESLRFSGTECLNLNLVTPKKVNHKVPVFVFFHGGGFVIGANSWPQYDPTRLVEMSIEMGSPVIGVNVNYRLGITGFIASQELLSAGIKTNNGLRDQKAALTWIRKNIEGFGGDPDNITVIGESAGAISCLLHLESREPLFKRITAMGGTPLLLKPLPLQVSEGIYNVVIEKLGLSELPPSERVKALKEATVEKLTAATSNLPLLPVIDGQLISTPATFSQWSFQEKPLPGIKWCESLMIGDCELDSSILFYMLNSRIERIEQEFLKSTERSLGDSTTRQNLLTEYQIGSSYGNSSDKSVTEILNFAHDIGFYAPLISIASGWPHRAYVYHFNEPCPWNGRFKGVANHILDVAFLFQNYNEFLDQSQRSSAKAFGEHFIKFTNGSEPFPPYRAGEGGAMVYGPGDTKQRFIRSSRSGDYKRRSAIFKIAESSSLEELSAAWNAFLQGP